MRIVLDLQGAQGENRCRGIGRASINLAKAFLRNQGEHEILIILNGLLPNTIEPIRAAFDGLILQENILVWHAQGPVKQIELNNDIRRKSAELLREAFLANLKPDIVHITSLFEGLHDNAVTSIGCFSQTIPTSVTVHDLIPRIYPEVYLANPLFKRAYENKLSHLRRANLWLANSESSRQDAIQFGLPEDRVINTPFAADPYFRSISVSASEKHRVREKYKLSRSFVMYAGGDDYRKNLAGLIRSYAKLPLNVRNKHQLAIVCSIHSTSQQLLEQIANQHGLSHDEVVFTNYVPETDLLVLYNLCKLFVFPSWYEGFGLPALEAMQCGAAVIGSDTSSLPEVIGWDKALFDPHSDDSIMLKMNQVLTDETFRKKLIIHGLKQAEKFSWDITATNSIAAFKKLHVQRRELCKKKIQISAYRQKLIFVSPLPSERTGIADYSAELLPELSRYYDIEIISPHAQVASSWVQANGNLRDTEWFRAHAHTVKRIIYHFGNNPNFHGWMLELLFEFPGIVVLHDFFLNGIYHSRGDEEVITELYRAHGYVACREYFELRQNSDKYPINLSVLQCARGVIVHSEYAKQLASNWYGLNFSLDWSVIPLLRTPPYKLDRIKARNELGLKNTDFLVCSFGYLGPNKLNYELLQAWVASDLSKNKHCKLIFVGDLIDKSYYEKLSEDIDANQNIYVTQWIDESIYHKYLAAADVAVQLRGNSIGETSAAVFDCMSYGLPLIVNKNGSFTELSRDAVLFLPDKFNIAQLAKALEDLWGNEELRLKMGNYARKVVLTNNLPSICAKQYFYAIEKFYFYNNDISHLLKMLSYSNENILNSFDSCQLAELIAQNQLSSTSPPFFRQLFLDVSELIQRDVKTGIQRVTRSLLKQFLENPPIGYRIEPVYATTDCQGYYYAHTFTLQFLKKLVNNQEVDSAIFDHVHWCNEQTDYLIEVKPGDIFFGLDFQANIVIAQQDYLYNLRQQGLQVYFFIYDLLPIKLSDRFVEGAAVIHEKWLQVLSGLDGAVCISQSVADEFYEWLQWCRVSRYRPLKIGWSHLGADVVNSLPTFGLPLDFSDVLQQLKNYPTFLMVGTLEPRKGHLQTLKAFENLWRKNLNLNLVIVGKKGWMIDELVRQLSCHPKLGKHLFWLEGISDEYLSKIYQSATCLIVSSEGEGFGLPLIEAAQHKIPLLVRDIPIFREVAREYAAYFSGMESVDLSNAIEEWLILFKEDKHPKSDNMPWLTWEKSAKNLLSVILNNNWYRSWMPDADRFFDGVGVV